MFPTDLTSFLALLHHHGEASYGFMFGYAFMHTLLLAIFAGYAAGAGALGFGNLIAVCWAGSFLGDVVRFWIGRRYGTRWLGGLPRVQRAVEMAARLADRHHFWMILVHRFPYGIRGVAGIAYGMSSISWPLFLVMNFVGAGLWATATVSAGYAFGYVSEKTMSDASSGVGLGLLVGFLALSWLLSRRLERALERN